MLIANWKEVLKKSAVVWVGVLGALLPELPDLALKWLDSDPSAKALSPEMKNYFRMALMLVAIPLARIWRQQSLRPDSAQPVNKPVLRE